MAWVYHNKPPMGWPLDLSEPINTSLVGYWLLNEGSGNKVFDLSGNGNTGTLLADAHFVPGPLGPALDFDGTDDGIAISQIVLGSDNTIAFWAKPNTDASYQIITNHAGQTSGRGGISILNPLKWRFRETSGAGGSSLEMPLIIGVWQFVVFTTQGTTTKAYFNGVFVTSASLSPFAQIDGLCIGFDINNIGYNGQLDLPMVFRRALSASEIALLYRFPFYGFMNPDEIPVLDQYYTVGVGGIAAYTHHYQQQL